METEAMLLSQVTFSGTCFPAEEPGCYPEILHHRFQNKKAKETDGSDPDPVSPATPEIQAHKIQYSSIGDGGSGPCCAKNPTQKNVPKTPPRKKPV